MRMGEPAIVGRGLTVHAGSFDDRVMLAHAMLIPFTSAGSAGLMTVARQDDRPSFVARDLDMGVSFAGHISVALDRADARSARRRVELLEDRNRIARDLHDHVIQRLFAAGLNLQAAASTANAGLATQITAQIKEIDGAITQIRQSIFAIHRESESTSASLRARILEIVDRSSDQLPQRPRVTFIGPVDLMADAALTDDMSAVVTEALANAIRHAQPDSVDIEVASSSGQASVEVKDDGVGLGPSPQLSGLSNLRQRAESRGGTFEIGALASGGTRVWWCVPV